MFDEGTGPTLVVIQPLQGRWEWMRPSLVALSKYARVISYTLCGDIGSGARMDPSHGFHALTRQLDAVMEHVGVRRVSLCGVSFGGCVALSYAARNPDRVSHLIVASSPGPGWRPTAQQAAHVERPWLSLPAVTVTALSRMGREVVSALPNRGARTAFALRFAATAVRFPALPHLTAPPVRLLQELDLAADFARITAPTLVITGEPALDSVVPVASTQEYVNRIHRARYAIIDRPGRPGPIPN